VKVSFGKKFIQIYGFLQIIYVKNTAEMFLSFYRMQYNQYVSLCLIALVLGQVAALPQHPQYTQQYPQQYQQQQIREERKFAEKPNAMKKVAIDDLEDISTNQIQVKYTQIHTYTHMNNLFNYYITTLDIQS